MTLFCPKCGTKNPDDGVQCIQCHEPLPQIAPAPQTAPSPDAYSAPAQQATPTPDPYSGQPPVQPQYQPPVQQPYAQNGYQPIPPRPTTFLAGNIILTVLGLCTCFPLITGIIGIIFSAMITSKYNAGDYEGARKAATVAKVMFFVTLGLVICSIIYWIVSVAVGMSYYMDIFDQIYYDMY
jgi:hypothetical protein